MTGSLLDECHKSILRIAETQPPDGRRAILMMAEMFRANFDNKRLGPVLASRPGITRASGYNSRPGGMHLTTRRHAPQE
jgi:hypothetical protein